MNPRNLLSPLRNTPLRTLMVWLQYRNVRPGDVLMASYPKSGNTWMRFMLAEAVARQEVDFTNVVDYMPRLALRIRSRATLPDGGRLIKTHESWCPPHSRAVYLVRDVRSVFVSYFHRYRRRWQRPDLSMEEFADTFLGGRADGYGTWGTHVTNWLKLAESNPNMLVIRYEDLRPKPQEVMSRVFSFLGLPADDGLLQQVIEHNSLERMRYKEQNEPATKGENAGDSFVRKGETAGWKQELPADIRRRLETEYRGLLERLCYPLEAS